MHCVLGNDQEENPEMRSTLFHRDAHLKGDFGHFGLFLPGKCSVKSMK